MNSEDSPYDPTIVSEVMVVWKEHTQVNELTLEEKIVVCQIGVKSLTLDKKNECSEHITRGFVIQMS